MGSPGFAMHDAETRAMKLRLETAIGALCAMALGCGGGGSKGSGDGDDESGSAADDGGTTSDRQESSGGASQSAGVPQG